MYEKVILVGYLGRDPEMKYTGSGTPVTNFSIACTQVWKDKDGDKQEKTRWYRISTWRGLAENCNKYLAKGRLVLIEANGVDASAYENNEGKPAASVEVTAQVVKFLGGGKNGGGNGGGGGGTVVTGLGAGKSSKSESYEDELQVVDL